MTDENHDFKITVNGSVDFNKLRNVCDALTSIGYACIIDEYGAIYITYDGEPVDAECE